MSKKIIITVSVMMSISAIVIASAKAHAGGPFTSKNKLGDVMMVMSPTYALGMTMMAKDWKGTLQLGESVLLAQLASEGIKSLEIEERPNGSDKKSFPSGHAAGAFSGAMFVHKRYGWKPALIPYGMSLIAGWSRVDAKAHYWQDVIGGAAISALFTWVLVDRYIPSGVNVGVDTDGVRVGFKTEF
ncbi:MAG: phosphatase PAP2 family protein [Alphaproteobacteria bacterium]|nr:phosphatase PAP2 family protein [Alphaproteobacteria bacterium]